MTVNSYRKKWFRFLDKQERYGVRLFRKAVQEAVASIPEYDVTAANFRAKVDMNLNKKPIEDAYFSYYLSVGSEWGRRVGNDINKGVTVKAFGFDDFINVFREFLIQWIRDTLITRVLSVNKELSEVITQQIAKAIEEGGAQSDLQSIVRKIKQDFRSNNTYRWQIERIVRTETGAAANLGAVQAARSSGLVWEKKWISSHDGRTRRRPKAKYDHYVMEGVKVPDNQPFDVQGDMLQFPGDPKGHPANVINCRCAVAVVAARDADGLPIFT